MITHPATTICIEYEDYKFWFCPACRELHFITPEFNFEGTLDNPIIDEEYNWNDFCYANILDAEIYFKGYSLHTMAGLAVPMQKLPSRYISIFHPSIEYVIENNSCTMA